MCWATFVICFATIFTLFRWSGTSWNISKVCLYQSLEAEKDWLTCGPALSFCISSSLTNFQKLEGPVPSRPSSLTRLPCTFPQWPYQGPRLWIPPSRWHPPKRGIHTGLSPEVQLPAPTSTRMCFGHTAPPDQPLPKPCLRMWHHRSWRDKPQT